MASETRFLACTSPPRLIVLLHIYVLYLLSLRFRTICLFCEAVATGEAKVINTTSGHGHEYSLIKRWVDSVKNLEFALFIK